MQNHVSGQCMLAHYNASNRKGKKKKREAVLTLVIKSAMAVLIYIFWLLPTCLKDTFCHVQLQSPLPELSRDLLLLMLISLEWGWDTLYAPVVCDLWRQKTRELSKEAAVGERKMNDKNVKILWNDNAAWRLIRKQDISDMEHHVWVQPTKILINGHELSFNV